MVSLPERLTLDAGTALFVEGESADAAYLVLRGTVELFRGEGAARTSVETRRRSDLIGETALLDERPRDTSAETTSACDLLVVTRDLLFSRISAVDPLLRFCFGALLDRAGGGRTPAAGLSPWGEHVEAARQILAVEYELSNGLTRNEFDVQFQPIVEIENRRLVGFEALVRWEHPQRGLLQPSDFIPLAEASGVISDVTRFCLRRVAACFPALKRVGLRNRAVGPLFLSVNVSGTDLLRPAFAAETASILCDGGVDPADVRLEITESILMADAERCATTLAQCRDQGFEIAIDDFGTGYSSLNYLHTLPVSILKMDRSFTFSLLEGAPGRKIVAAILRLGQELGLSVIAEGIEDEQQAALLEAMGCPLGQGYLFGRALGLEETLRLIEGWERAPDRRAERLAALA